MVLVDVVMVRTEDTITATRGVNLLNALNLQFGSASAAAFSRIRTDTANAASTTVLTKTITVPALTYSLNIANANSNLNEVLARPTLAALENMKSEFFSGSSLNAAVVSTGRDHRGIERTAREKLGFHILQCSQRRPRQNLVEVAVCVSDVQ